MAAPAAAKATNKLKIAVIPGDGIGNEVVPEGIKVLEAVGARFGLDYAWDHLRLVVPALRQDRRDDAGRRARADRQA